MSDRCGYLAPTHRHHRHHQPINTSHSHSICLSV